jgi:hypothetical protein
MAVLLQGTTSGQFLLYFELVCSSTNADVLFNTQRMNIAITCNLQFTGVSNILHVSPILFSFFLIYI